MIGRMRRTRELRNELFGRMMQRFGAPQSADDVYPEGAMLRIAAARCIHCTETRRCMAWLTETTGTQGASEFCPNAATFAALAARARRRS